MIALGGNWTIIPATLVLALGWLLSGIVSDILFKSLLQIVVLLAFAVIFGRAAQRLHQPSVLGEILGGIILGPTILGTVAPSMQFWLFPVSGESAQILRAVAYLGLIAFVFTAGLEVNLACARRRIRTTLLTSSFGILLPFALGFSVVVLLPELWGIPSGDLRIFALFMGTALSISALPVIARILMDLDLLNKEIGTMILSAATIDDMIGWSLFALILSSLNKGISLELNMCLTLVPFVLTFYLLYIEGKNETGYLSSYLDGLVDLIAVAMLAASVISEVLGAHAIYGAFLAGVILSQKRKRRDFILKKTYPLVIGILAPVYFTSIGLKANFATNFDLSIVLLVFIVACAGKIIGAGLGAKLSGLPGKKALAIGFGMNARGAMEIVLASAALDYGLIGPRIFVALVVMAFVTTMIGGSMIQKLMITKPSLDEFRIEKASAFH
jgi:Kef-type K+ transport system membrane component KefB